MTMIEKGDKVLVEATVVEHLCNDAYILEVPCETEQVNRFIASSAIDFIKKEDKGMNKEGFMRGVWEVINILDSEGWSLLHEYPISESHASREHQELITSVKARLEILLREEESDESE